MGMVVTPAAIKLEEVIPQAILMQAGACTGLAAQPQRADFEPTPPQLSLEHVWLLCASGCDLRTAAPLTLLFCLVRCQ
jgi:hypothetical protein